MKEYSRGQNNRQYNHQQLGTSISQYVSCYGIVYRDPNGTPDNEQDDWYSSISDRIPAKEFVTILTNCTAMVDHGSINRIKARRIQQGSLTILQSSIISINSNNLGVHF